MEQAWFPVRLYHLYWSGRVRDARERRFALAAAPWLASSDVNRRCRRAESDHAALRADPAGAARRLVAASEERLQRLKAAVTSPTFIGACVDLEVTDRLAGLSDQYVVLNGLDLVLPNAVRF